MLDLAAAAFVELGTDRDDPVRRGSDRLDFLAMSQVLFARSDADLRDFSRKEIVHENLQTVLFFTVALDARNTLSFVGKTAALYLISFLFENAHLPPLKYSATL